MSNDLLLHHLVWLFNPGTSTATATRTFTLDQEVTVACGQKLKVENNDGSRAGRIRDEKCTSVSNSA
jgi:hypothetical protein